jgi:hypothetical protein
MFAELADEWKDVYAAGMFTEFMEQRAPGHLDQHLTPFYEQGLADGTLTRESARELLECFFVKFNNHPAPPKVGVTAAGRGRRFRRDDAPAAGGQRGDAPAAAQQQRAGQSQDA